MSMNVNGDNNPKKSNNKSNITKTTSNQSEITLFGGKNTKKSGKLKE